MNGARTLVNLTRTGQIDLRPGVFIPVGQLTENVLRMNGTYLVNLSYLSTNGTPKCP